MYATISNLLQHESQFIILNALRTFQSNCDQLCNQKYTHLKFQF